MANAFITRLWFNGRRGVIQHDGATVILHEPPELPGLPNLSEIDYAPSLSVFDVRLGGQARRDITEAECAAAQALIESKVKSAR